MTSHRILIIWIAIYITLLFICLCFFLYFDAIRIKIATLLVGLLLSFIFYPIYILDKRNYTRLKNAQKTKKLKVTSSELYETEKKKEEKVIVEQVSKTQDEIEKNINITCNLCGKKVHEDVKLCPYCGIEF